MNNQHYRRPWKRFDEIPGKVLLLDSSGHPVAMIFGRSTPEKYTTAELILKAVNNYNGLFEESPRRKKNAKHNNSLGHAINSSQLSKNLVKRAKARRKLQRALSKP